MFPIDMPPVPPQEQTIVIAQADSAQQQVTGKERILGVCHPVPNSIPPEGARGEYVVDPIYNAEGYFIKYEHKTVTGATNVTVLKEPQNGTLQLMTAANVASFGFGRFVEGSKSYAYFPNPGYIGKDRATFLVDIGGQKVKVVYFFQSVGHPLGNTGFDELCAKTGYTWKISSTLDASGNSTITSIEYQSPTTSATGSTAVDAALATTLGTSLLSTLAGETKSKGPGSN